MANSVNCDVGFSVWGVCSLSSIVFVNSSFVLLGLSHSIPPPPLPPHPPPPPPPFSVFLYAKLAKTFSFFSSTYSLYTSYILVNRFSLFFIFLLCRCGRWKRIKTKIINQRYVSKLRSLNWLGASCIEWTCFDLIKILYTNLPNLCTFLIKWSYIFYGTASIPYRNTNFVNLDFLKIVQF